MSAILEEVKSTEFVGDVSWGNQWATPAGQLAIPSQDGQQQIANLIGNGVPAIYEVRLFREDAIQGLTPEAMLYADLSYGLGRCQEVVTIDWPVGGQSILLPAVSIRVGARLVAPGGFNVTFRLGAGISKWPGGELQAKSPSLTLLKGTAVGTPVIIQIPRRARRLAVQPAIGPGGGDAFVSFRASGGTNLQTWYASTCSQLMTEGVPIPSNAAAVFIDGLGMGLVSPVVFYM
jgi:hypothetical protein